MTLIQKVAKKDRKLLMQCSPPEYFDAKTCHPECRYLRMHKKYNACYLPTEAGNFSIDASLGNWHGEILRTASCRKRFAK
jgi:hypothetical protein